MKGIYIVQNEESLVDNKSGISKKIYSQINVFNNYGLNCELFALEDGKTSHLTLLNYFIIVLPFSNICPQWKYYDQMRDCSYVYIRKPFYFSNAMVKTLKKLKKNNTKIILEVPTYPYDDQYIKLGDRLLLIKDIINRRRLSKCVDRIFYIGEKEIGERLWGIPANRIINGIDFNTIVVKKPIAHSSINLICVSSCCFWHGYDRLLRGMIKYYSDLREAPIRVNAFIVGEGEELESYKELVQKGNITEYVNFFGKVYGNDLDKLYDMSDIAIGSLGLHRIGISIASTLKSRESLAKGMPCVEGGKVEILSEEECHYVLEIPRDESDIDIYSIIKFYHNVYDNKEADQVVETIRNYSREYIDIDKVMKPVIDYMMS